MYPPKCHIENHREKVYRVIEEYSFATLISRTENDVIITQLPIILDRNRGKHGFLIGHIDRHNPHVDYLDKKNVSVIFHGPNSYISPTTYETTQLPTWNSVSVHIKGMAYTITSENIVRNALINMTSFFERGEDRFILKSDNNKMKGLVGHILSFEIEINDMTGRFKLSQDKTPNDMALAKQKLITKTKEGCEEIFNFLL